MRRAPVAGIVGLGLVGGSLARVLTAAGWRVLGVDRAGVVRAARRARAIAASSTLPELAAEADVIVLAAPPAANLRLLDRLARLGPRGLVTDVGSVKAPIVTRARARRLAFVGGHPMAGRARSGFAESRADLFAGRPWILTARARRDVPAVLRRLVRDAGARLHVLDAATHDRVVAFLSHAPQVVAWALFEAASRDPVVRRHLGVAGPGFADMTRLSASPRGLWREILEQNAHEVARALRAVRARLRVTV